MKLICGLGNPGESYRYSRHNVGFLTIDDLIQRFHAQGPYLQEQGETYRTSIENHKVLFIKPLTYMNQSGSCIGPLFYFYKCHPEDLIVIHDDLDLQPFTLRLKTGGGTGGHNGLKLFDAHLGSSQTDYHRIRIGIGKPEHPDHHYVLKPMHTHELKTFETLYEKIETIVKKIIEGKIHEAMNQFNRRTP